jgi:flagellar hook-associated protein 1 FlgK
LGSLFSAFNIAQSGLSAAQIQLDTAGHNIANATKEGFSRQRVDLVSRPSINLGVGYIGTGVGVAGITRVRDEFLDGLYQEQVAGLGFAEYRAESFQQIEDIFLEPTENGLSSRINFFFETLNEFAANVESIPVRQSVLTEAQALASVLNDTASRLESVRTNANEQVINLVPTVNGLAERIATLNKNIVRQEIGGNAANDLRDERTVLLDQLGKLVNIFSRERDNGSLDVLISGEVLVDGINFRELEAVPNAALDPERNDLVEVRFVDTGNLLDIRNGEIKGALDIRDITVVDIDNDMDIVTATIIEEFNRIHSQGNGIADFSSPLTSTNAVTDPNVVLNSAGLPFTVSNGTFEINIYDVNGVPTASSPATITIGAATTLNDIVGQINAVPDISASVNATGFLTITPAANTTFGFANDTTNFLGSMGVNTFFTGSDARTIGVNQTILDSPELLASGYSADPLDTGDNTAALDLLGVQNGKFLFSNTATINDFYETMIVGIGVDARTNTENLELEQTFVESFDRRRQEVAGVSLDEEVALLIQYQRAFEASARVVTVTDRMLDALFSIAL